MYDEEVHVENELDDEISFCEGVILQILSQRLECPRELHLTLSRHTLFSSTAVTIGPQNRITDSKKKMWYNLI